MVGTVCLNASTAPCRAALVTAHFAMQVVALEGHQLALVQGHGVDMAGAIAQPGLGLAVGQGGGLAVAQGVVGVAGDAGVVTAVGQLMTLHLGDQVVGGVEVKARLAVAAGPCRLSLDRANSGCVSR